MLNRKKSLTGFTLIELLVVIAIIGILAAIVLTSVGGARNQAKDARIISDMGQLRNIAEIHYSTNGSYSGLCSNADVTKLQSDITSQGGTAWKCTQTQNQYCIYAKLNNNQYWCVDSQLTSKQVSSTVPMTPCESTTDPKCP